MKHVILVSKDDKDSACIRALTSEGSEVFLAQKEYTDEEMAAFTAEADKWLIRLKGTRCFLADSDSGEDATGYYCNHFPLRAENAVFDDGVFVGMYYSFSGLRYSGNDRASFGIDSWGYPGKDPFCNPWSETPHVFLFSEENTHTYKEWSLIVKEEGKEYGSYLDF